MRISISPNMTEVEISAQLAEDNLRTFFDYAGVDDVMTESEQETLADNLLAVLMEREDDDEGILFDEM